MVDNEFGGWLKLKVIWLKVNKIFTNSDINGQFYLGMINEIIIIIMHRSLKHDT